MAGVCVQASGSASIRGKAGGLTLAGVALLLVPGALSAQSAGIRLSATNHNFVSVPQGSTQKYGIRLDNDSGQPFPFALTLKGSDHYRETNDCPATVAVGASCEIIFTYTAPADSTAWEQADFTIAEHGVSFTPAAGGWLRAHPVQAGLVSFNSEKHNFLTVPVGTAGAGASGPFGLLIANGSTADLPFSYKAEGDSKSFDVTSQCPPTLKAGGQCSVMVTFRPESAGWKRLDLAVSAAGGQVENGGRVVLIGAGRQP